MGSSGGRSHVFVCCDRPLPVRHEAWQNLSVVLPVLCFKPAVQDIRTSNAEGRGAEQQSERDGRKVSFSIEEYEIILLEPSIWADPSHGRRISRVQYTVFNARAENSVGSCWADRNEVRRYACRAHHRKSSLFSDPVTCRRTRRRVRVMAAHVSRNVTVIMAITCWYSVSLKPSHEQLCHCVSK